MSGRTLRTHPVLVHSTTERIEGSTPCFQLVRSGSTAKQRSCPGFRGPARQRRRRCPTANRRSACDRRAAGASTRNGLTGRGRHCPWVRGLSRGRQGALRCGQEPFNELLTQGLRPDVEPDANQQTEPECPQNEPQPHRTARWRRQRPRVRHAPFGRCRRQLGRILHRGCWPGRRAAKGLPGPPSRQKAGPAIRAEPAIARVLKPTV